MKKKIFVGRENELEQFRQAMRKLQNKQQKEEHWANTFLVCGVGGMGKTTLCNKFKEITEKKFPGVKIIGIDWDLCKNRGSTFTPEELLDTVSREFNRVFPKEMKPYLNAKKGIREVQEQIEKLVEQKRQSLGTVSELAGEVTSTVSGSKTLGTLAATTLGLVGKALRALDEKFLKEKAGVSDEKLLLYKDPLIALARDLLDCIRAVTNKKDNKILLLFDTCELIVQVEQWFSDHFLLPLVNGNNDVMVVFSGRHYPYAQRTVVIDGKPIDIRGMADRMSFPPQVIDMKLFSRADIEKYLRESDCDCSEEEVIDFVQSYSRGVPYAVDLLTNALKRIGAEGILLDFAGEEFKEQLKEAESNEEVIRCVSRRFLKYCLDEPTDLLDRQRILSIAVLDDTDPEVLRAVWQVENSGQVLEELQAKYALFIDKGKLHDVVKDFLVDYILEDDSLRLETTVPLAKKALHLYEKKYIEECEEEPVWAERFREEIWKEALLHLMNVKTWIDPDEAVDFFIQRGIELFLFSPALVRQMKGLLDRFLKLEKVVRRRKRRKINALMEVLDAFSWYIGPDEETREGLTNVLSFCREALEEWELEQVHRAVVQLIKGRCEYLQKNYDAALKTLLEEVDDTRFEKSLKDRLAEALDEAGKKFTLDEKNNFFFSEKALRAFEKVVQLNDKKSSYLHHLGVMMRLGGKPRDALSYYLKATELDPKDKYIFNGLGLAYSNLGEYDKAIRMYEKAMELDPKYAYPYNGLGIVYSNLGEYDKAIRMFEKTIELEIIDAYPYNHLGYLHLIRGNYREATANLQKSIEIEPNIFRYINLGIAHYCLDEIKKSKDCFEKGLSCKKIGESIIYRLSKVTALLGLEKKDEALALLGKISEKTNPANLVKEFFTDWKILASAPHPPPGLADFLEQARHMLNYEEKG